MTDAPRAVAAWRLPGTRLPDGTNVQLWAVDGRITDAEPAAWSPLPGRFVSPGLVDAHTHVGIRDREPVGPAAMRAALRSHASAGVLLVRDLGARRGETLELEYDDGPRMQASGRLLATAETFFGWQEPVAPDDLVDAALREVTRGASWVKVIADWDTPEPAYDPALLADLVRAVHARGARVAAHTQWERARDVVAAGVDSIEHGCLLDEPSLREMARRGTAWTPTLGALTAPLPDEAPDEWRKVAQRWRDNYRRMLPLAAELGVTILAGADNTGTAATEAAALVEYGLSAEHALRAATTDARAFLGEPALEPGSPADVVTFDADPRADATALERPAAVLLGGRRLR